MSQAIQTRSTTSKLALVALGLGIVAALLTTTLAFLSLVLAAATFISGSLAVRRDGVSVPAVVGMSAAAVSAYVIVLEIFVVG